MKHTLKKIMTLVCALALMVCISRNVVTNAASSEPMAAGPYYGTGSSSISAHSGASSTSINGNVSTYTSGEYKYMTNWDSSSGSELKYSSSTNYGNWNSSVSFSCGARDISVYEKGRHSFVYGGFSASCDTSSYY